MGTGLSSELGKVKGGEEEEWHPTSVTSLPVQIHLTASSRRLLKAMEQPSPFYIQVAFTSLKM